MQDNFEESLESRFENLFPEYDDTLKQNKKKRKMNKENKRS